MYEVVDNSIDEAVNKHASLITVKINADGSVSCQDDGRGIPFGAMPDNNNRPALEVVLTEIHAGGKFDREGGYKTGTGGLHGVGITAVNALSEWLEAEVRREGYAWRMEFQRGVVTGDLKKLGATEKTGTRITFRPDAEIFPDIEFDFDILSRRLQELAFLNAGVRIRIADDRTGQTDEYFYEQGLIEFVNYLNRTEDVLFSQVISLDGVQDSEDGEVEVSQCNEIMVDGKTKFKCSLKIKYIINKVIKSENISVDFEKKFNRGDKIKLYYITNQDKVYFEKYGKDLINYYNRIAFCSCILFIVSIISIIILSKYIKSI